MSEITPHVLAELSAYLDGRLSGAERQTVETHLQSCSKCRQHHQELRSLRQMLHKSPLLHPPESFFQAILRRIEGKKTPEPGWGVSLKALVSLCVVMFVVLVSRQIHKQSPLAPAEPVAGMLHNPVRLTEVAKEKKKAEAVDTLASVTPAKKTAQAADAENSAIVTAVADVKTDVADKDKMLQELQNKAEQTPSVEASRLRPEPLSQARGISGAASPMAFSAPESRRKQEAPFLSAAPSATAPAARTFAVAPAEWKGTDSGIDQFRTVIIGSLPAWQALWREHTQFSGTPPPLPNVDFAQSMVVGVYAGQKPSSGYSIEITGTRATATEFIVEYREITPPAGGVQATVLTEPYHLRLIPQTPLPILFKKQ